MNPAVAPPPRMRRLRRLVLFLAIACLLALWLLQPERAGQLLLWQAGKALNLQISAQSIDYSVRGIPRLELRDVVAQRSSDPATLLRAKRVFIALPWRTLHSMGDDLRIERIALDAPELNLPALQRWLATRPPSKTRIPVITHGVQLRDGRIVNDDWQIDQLAIHIPSLHPTQLLRMRVQGRYHAASLKLPVDLAISLQTPQRLLEGQRAGIAGAGHMTLADAQWRVPLQIFLAGPLRIGKDSALLQPAKLGLTGRYENGSTQLPFRLGLFGPMAFNSASWRFVPATLVLHGGGPIPDTQARGSLTLGQTLRLHLQGQLAQWPQQWPALPAPLSASHSALPFVLDYRGAPGLTDALALSLRRDATTFDAQLRLPAVVTWVNAGNTGSPLPPLTGTLSTPRIDIGGAVLDGVEVDIRHSP